MYQVLCHLSKTDVLCGLYDNNDIFDDENKI